MVGDKYSNMVGDKYSDMIRSTMVGHCHIESLLLHHLYPYEFRCPVAFQLRLRHAAEISPLMGVAAARSRPWGGR